jgi:hypothetical protein
MHPAKAGAFSFYGKVRTLHVLSGGEVIDSLEKQEQVSKLFTWVNKAAMIARVPELRRLV